MKITLLVTDMKRVLLPILMALLLTSCGSQIVYSHRPLAAEGCRVRYTAIYQDNAPLLFVEVMSDRLIFTGTPTIKLKTFDGEIFTLDGVSLATSSETSGMVIGSVVVPISELQAKAQFSITDDQIKLLNKGISKVRISTAPITHERTFSQDVIGKRLFKQFESVKKKTNEF